MSKIIIGWVLIFSGVGIIGHFFYGLQGVVYSIPIGLGLNLFTDYLFKVGLFANDEEDVKR